MKPNKRTSKATAETKKATSSKSSPKPKTSSATRKRKPAPKVTDPVQVAVSTTVQLHRVKAACVMWLGDDQMVELGDEIYQRFKAAMNVNEFVGYLVISDTDVFEIALYPALIELKPEGTEHLLMRAQQERNLRT